MVVSRADASDTFGTGTPVATLRIDEFEFVRALTGRRSLDQIAAYHWDGTFAPEHLVLARFVPRPEPLVE